MTEQWRDAISELAIRHLDWTSTVNLELLDGNPPSLALSVSKAKDTGDGRVIEQLMVSTVKLTFWPGKRIAQAWLAAAWAGYQQHEALELVTLTTGGNPLDPHADIAHDRGLRDGLPVELTPETMRRAFLAVMSAEAAEAYAC